MLTSSLGGTMYFTQQYNLWSSQEMLQIGLARAHAFSPHLHSPTIFHILMHVPSTCPYTLPSLSARLNLSTSIFVQIEHMFKNPMNTVFLPNVAFQLHHNFCIFEKQHHIRSLVLVSLC